MSITTPPPPVQQKESGLGCLGCGCAVLFVIFALIVALVAGSCYYAYTKGYALTSATAADVPIFNGSDEIYKSTQQKLSDFDHDVKNHQAATIHLSADEINTMIAHSPELSAHNGHAYVSITGDEVHLQGSIPLENLPFGIYKGRYANVDSTFGVEFDASSKQLILLLHSMKFGDQVTPNNMITALQPQLNLQLNLGLRKDVDASRLLDSAKSISVKDGELVIETQ